MALLALMLVTWSGAPAPTPVAELPPRRHPHATEAPAPRLPPKEIEWLDHAIDRILQGD